MTGGDVYIAATDYKAYNRVNISNTGNVEIKSNQNKTGAKIKINDVEIDNQNNVTNVKDLTATGDLSVKNLTSTGNVSVNNFTSSGVITSTAFIATSDIGTGDNESTTNVNNLNVSGNTNVKDIIATGNISANSFIATSDERLKKNIKPLKDSLNKINNISGYTYDWVNTGFSDIGVVAQEVQSTFPIGIVHDSADGIKRVDYSKFAPLFIESIKELTDMVKNLKKRIEILETDQE